MRKQAPAYEQRMIVFVDFLGFREVVARSIVDSEILPALFKAIDYVAEIGEDDVHTSKRVSQFSDSMVVSYRVQEESAVFHLLNLLKLTIIDVLDQGFLLRGAVTVGQLFHSDKYLVGPAMVRVYEMESNEAVYPRVIVDDRLMDVARASHNNIHSPDDEEEYVRSLLARDFDGKHYLDYVSYDSVVANAGAPSHLYGRYLTRMCGIIERGLHHPEQRVRDKYLWLHAQYLEAVELTASEKSESNFRLENQDCASRSRFCLVSRMLRKRHAQSRKSSVPGHRRAIGNVNAPGLR